MMSDIVITMMMIGTRLLDFSLFGIKEDGMNVLQSPLEILVKELLLV